MDRPTFFAHRREVMAGLAGSALVAAFAGTARAQGFGGAITDILGRASDSSLDKLAQPGAFYNDEAIRIALPLIGGGALGGMLGSAMNTGQKLGITDNVVRKLNDAAGLAAREAKPVFRSAIDQMTLADVPDIATQDDGATQYLRRSAGDDLKVKLRPLIDTALVEVGAFGQLDSLARKSKWIRKAGITRDRLGSSVTDQALSGIFSYIGAEEGRLRANPLGKAGSLFKGILGN